MRILLAEDEKALSRALVKILVNNNYSVDAVYNGDDALYYILNGNYDVAILDIVMPKLDGLSVLKELRAKAISIPIIILSAKSDTNDKVLALDSGANDYITKPFDSEELLARIRVATREPHQTDSLITIGNITLDRANYELSSPSGKFKLTNKEFQIMEYLMSNPNKLISSESFMEKIWGLDSNSEINVVWVYISYLRKKLVALSSDINIKAKRNIGYYLSHNDD